MDEVRKLKFFILVIQVKKSVILNKFNIRTIEKTFLWNENKMQWYFDGVLKRTETNPGKFVDIHFKVFILSLSIMIKFKKKLWKFILKT